MIPLIFLFFLSEVKENLSQNIDIVSENNDLVSQDHDILHLVIIIIVIIIIVDHKVDHYGMTGLYFKTPRHSFENVSHSSKILSQYVETVYHSFRINHLNQFEIQSHYFQMCRYFEKPSHYFEILSH